MLYNLSWLKSPRAIKMSPLTGSNSPTSIFQKPLGRWSYGSLQMVEIMMSRTTFLKVNIIINSAISYGDHSHPN